MPWNRSHIFLRKQTLIILIACLSFASSNSLQRIAGPFQVLARESEKCPPELDAAGGSKVYLLGARSNSSQPTSYSGNFTIPFIVNNSLSVRVTLATGSSTDGWKDSDDVLKFKHLCTFLSDTLLNNWRNFRQTIFGEVPECPFYQGYYRFENFSLSFLDLPIRHFFYGRWRATVQVTFENNDIAACQRALLDTAPM